MKKFEVSKIYVNGGKAWRIDKITKTKITFTTIQHLGRFNERECDTRTKKLCEHSNCEWFYDGHDECDADFEVYKPVTA